MNIDIEQLLLECSITIPSQPEPTNPGVVFTRKDTHMIEGYCPSEELTLALTWEAPDTSTTWMVGYLASLALDRAHHAYHLTSVLEDMLEEGTVPEQHIGLVRTVVDHLANYADGNDVRYLELLLIDVASKLAAHHEVINELAL